MSTLEFRVTGATPSPRALVPTIAFDLQVTAPPDLAVQSMLLRCQVRVEPARRPYDEAEQAGLQGLFGEPHRWADTLRAFPLTHVTLPVRGFSESTVVTMPVELTYDMEVATGQYLHALRDGTVPLLFLFSGSVFIGRDGAVQVEQVPWDREARYDLPVAVWRDVIDAHFPDSGWIRLQRDTIDALAAHRHRHARLGWDDTIAHLLAQQEVQA
jgi:hypothetical protein